MRHPKISIATSAAVTGVWAFFTVFFLTFNTIGGYFGAVMFLLLTLFWSHRLYSKLWLYNSGKPLSEAKKRRREQMRRQVSDYKRYSLSCVVPFC